MQKQLTIELETVDGALVLSIDEQEPSLIEVKRTVGKDLFSAGYIDMRYLNYNLIHSTLSESERAALQECIDEVVRYRTIQKCIETIESCRRGLPSQGIAAHELIKSISVLREQAAKEERGARLLSLILAPGAAEVAGPPVSAQAEDEAPAQPIQEPAKEEVPAGWLYSLKKKIAEVW